MDEIIGLGARAVLAEARRDAIHVEVLLFATLASGGRVETVPADGSLGFGIQRIKSVAVREGEEAPAGAECVTQEDLRGRLAGVARDGLDVLEHALARAGIRATALGSLPLELELDEALVRELPPC